MIIEQAKTFYKIIDTLDILTNFMESFVVLVKQTTFLVLDIRRSPSLQLSRVKEGGGLNELCRYMHPQMLWVLNGFVLKKVILV